jgi:hypothetical protein
MPETSVFLCHSSSDKAFVRRLSKDLMKFGVAVWVDEEHIGVGDSIFESINAGLRSCEHSLLCFQREP